ncbi:MAG TPA: TniQ family protein [Nocardioides sp.]|nr:TniQ family protein [Nocardioides sp.]
MQSDMPMLADLTPLPVTIAPVAGEALDGYLERLGAANALPHPVLVQRLAEAGAPTAFLATAPAERLIANLAALTRLDPVALRCCTLASMVGIDTNGLDPANKNTWRRVAARGWPPGHGTALCPRCLDEDGVWQLRWRHPWVTTCSRHNCWLLERCPTCGNPFRSHRTPLRAVDAAPDRCGNPGRARGRGCQQSLGELIPVRASTDVLVAQHRIDAAIGGQRVVILGDALNPNDYLCELKALTVLLLHLAAQPDGEQRAEWADLARTDHTRSAGSRGARWGLAPPADLQLRGQAIAAADEILRAKSLDAAADQLHPWTELTPASNDGQLGWLADHTTMTPQLRRLVMAATATRRRLATLLDNCGGALPLTAIPQITPAGVYDSHVVGTLDVAARTGRLFVSLCLARQDLANLTWAEAAVALGLPPEFGTKTARACSADLLAPAGEFIATLARVADHLDTKVDYRAREGAVRRLARSRGWYRPWARRHLPGSHATSQPYAVTWLWTEYAHGHIDTSPGWQRPPDRHDRAHYRAFVRRLDQPATDALAELIRTTAVATRRTA